MGRLHLSGGGPGACRCSRLAPAAGFCVSPSVTGFVLGSCRYSYMIDNVILLITGTLHQRSISELVPKCHPLGSFEQMEAVNIAQTPAELYNAILVDTPLGEWSLSKYPSAVRGADVPFPFQSIRVQPGPSRAPGRQSSG